MAWRLTQSFEIDMDDRWCERFQNDARHLGSKLGTILGD
jgi:hypothetical protein